jgi:hypothetical protein
MNWPMENTYTKFVKNLFFLSKIGVVRHTSHGNKEGQPTKHLNAACSAGELAALLY